MPSNLLQIMLIVLAVFLAILAVELKDMLRAVTAFGGISVTIGSLFWLLNAPYVAIFQLLVYAGAVMVLFIVTVMLTKIAEKSPHDA